VTIAAARLGTLGSVLQQLACSTRSLSAGSELTSLASATGWLNSPPLTPADLRGRVVLIDFWTYTCINWVRSLPYVRAWAEKYADRGLVVIGVHTPEFEFEHDVGNVRRAAAEMRVTYPIAIDNDYAIWRGFQNAYWPALYLVDARGRVRYHHFGEGEYEQSERAIMRLLTQAGAGELDGDLVSVHAQGAEAAAAWGSLKSSETYVGYERGANFASPGGAAPGEPRIYIVPARLALNQWALSGDWTVGRQPVTLNASNGRIVHRFHARDLHLVMGPRTRGAPVRFRVRIDGRPPGAAHGDDVDDQGNGTLAEQRLYQLIRQPQRVVDREFEIEFLDPGAEAFAFTFG